jgi:hypothetical protein
MLKKIFCILLYFFAVIGLVSSSIFIAMQFGLLNVRGSIIQRNSFFGPVLKTDNTNGCLGVFQREKNSICAWSETVEWRVVHDGLLKDAGIIDDVSQKTGVPARMVAAAVVPEQIRFFTSNREIFKKYFEPFKVLGSMSQFSLGISGIKQETANDIEKYANDKSSPFYPGAGMGALIAYSSDTNHDTELYNRLTDSKNHYYSYLYTALYLKEITSQWKRASFDIAHRPDVLVTLFNVGFKASVPKANPVTAGSTISVGGSNYSFGELGTLFYNSNGLTDVFPI